MNENTADMFEPANDSERIGFRLSQHGIAGEWRGIGKEEVRRRIVEGHLTTVICWRDSATRKPRSYADAFEDVFGEPFTPRLKGKRC